MPSLKAVVKSNDERREFVEIVEVPSGPSDLILEFLAETVDGLVEDSDFVGVSDLSNKFSETNEIVGRRSSLNEGVQFPSSGATSVGITERSLEVRNEGVPRLEFLSIWLLHEDLNGAKSDVLKETCRPSNLAFFGWKSHRPTSEC